MSDVHDPLQEVLEDLLRKPVDPSPDKKIVFGARKPTEDTVALMGGFGIIEAPFPYERTLQWEPDTRSHEKNDNVTDSEGAEEPRSTSGVDETNEESSAGEETPPAAPSLTQFDGNNALVVSQEVLLKVNEHVSQSLERELGGFLLGNRYRCPNTHRDYVIIDQYSPAKFIESTQVNLSFTHEAWAQLSDELTGKFLGKLLIGWYHSHPRMDVFLSSHDMDIHTERFQESWMVALVLEPEKHRGGFFAERDGRVNPNAPVQFFELLERNSRDSVLAWANYSAADVSTAPVITNNIATISGSQTALVDRKEDQQAPSTRKRRGGLWISLVVVLLLLALLVVNRQRLRSWLQNRATAPDIR